MGVRLQRLREERGISQVALAKALGISPSYLNQIEHNQRPLTVAILLRINAEFGVDVQLFSDDKEAGLIADVRDVLAEVSGAGGAETVSMAELRSLASNMPAVARAIVELHRRNRGLNERADSFAARLGDGHKLASFALPGTHDEVRDYFNQRHNHIAELDVAAEAIFADSGLAIGDVASRLALRLSTRHGVRLQIASTDDSELRKRRYDAETRTLRLPDQLRPGQQAFQMAVQLAGTGNRRIARRTDRQCEVHQRRVTSPGAGRSGQLFRRCAGDALRGLPAIGRGAGLRHRATVEPLRSRLRSRSAIACRPCSGLACRGCRFSSSESIAPAMFSKRHSAADFHFSRIGGTCPLWIVYEAFSQPERVLTQTAVMPDGRSYLWIARQVVSGPVGYGRPQKTFAIGLGCDLRHAHRLIYSRGLDLSDPEAATPIGTGCKVCERQRCPQRAAPSLLDH